jgi:hypothetical protein
MRGGSNLYSYSLSDPLNYLDIEGKNPAAAALVAVGGFCAGYYAGKGFTDWQDPIEIQDSLSLIEKLLEDIHRRLEKCDAATAAGLLESRQRLVESHLQLTKALGGGNPVVDFAIGGICNAMIAAGFYIGRLPPI